MGLVPTSEAQSVSLLHSAVRRFPNSVKHEFTFGTGLYGLKPSYGRFATLGARSGMPGQEAVRSINGPMSSSLEAVKLWAKTVIDDKPWERDPGMIPIPWREVDVKGKKLSFGMWTAVSFNPPDSDTVRYYYGRWNCGSDSSCPAGSARCQDFAGEGRP